MKVVYHHLAVLYAMSGLALLIALMAYYHIR